MPHLTATSRVWLSLLREEVASADLLPKAYARYQPLLADALSFFLARISSVRLQQIFSHQAQLPASTPTAQRVVCLLEQLPVLHKLGQVIARDRRLKAPFRRQLQQLESSMPQLAAAQVIRLLGRALQNWQRAGIVPGPQPLAEGSVALIMPFVWNDAPQGPRHGVFKLLKPGIRAKLQEDLEILSQLGGFLDEECHQLDLPSLDYKDTFDTIRDLLLHEVSFDEEQTNLAEAAKMYQETEGVTIPALLPFCSSKVTAMDRLFGRKIKEDGALGPRLREATGRAIIRALIATPIFSPKPAALFHADPHAGNLLMMPNGRVGVLDWSLTGRLEKRQRIYLVQMALGALTLDVRWIESALEKLSCRDFERPAARQILQRKLNAFRWGTMPGINWLISVLDELVLKAGLRLDSNLLLFRKSLLTLDGLVGDLAGMKKRAGDALLDETVLAEFMARWIYEWPRRFCTQFEDRSFSTHISAVDLVRLILSAPAALARQLVTPRAKPFPH